jgi:hypothetical protein
MESLQVRCEFIHSLVTQPKCGHRCYRFDLIGILDPPANADASYKAQQNKERREAALEYGDFDFPI